MKLLFRLTESVFGESTDETLPGGALPGETPTGKTLPDETDWSAFPIPHKGVAIHRIDGTNGSSLVLSEGASADAQANVLRFESNGSARAALIVPPAGGAVPVFVDGEPPLGVVVLERRSELLIGGETVYFTPLGVLTPAPFTRDPASTPVACPRCTLVFETGDIVLTCSCGTVQHEGLLARPGGETRRCFSDGNFCLGCGRTRDEFEWLPHDIAPRAAGVPGGNR